MPTDLPPRPKHADRAATDGAARATLLVEFALLVIIGLLILGVGAGLAVRAFCWLSGMCG